MLFQHQFLKLLFVTAFATGLVAQRVTIATWNLQHFGRTKTDVTISQVAEILESFDVVAIQEVVGKKGGVHAINRLTARLNRGKIRPIWKSAVSEITTGNPNESDRYAFVWNSSKVKLIGSPYLHQKYAVEIVREPYLATFSVSGKSFTLVNFHAVPKGKQPEHEIKFLKYFPKEFPDYNLIFLGDFNAPQWNNVFNPLKKMHYRPAVINQKTTLKMKCVHRNCLASEYDNIFYSHNRFQMIDSGVVHFYRNFPNMVLSRKVSDHVPVFVTVKFK